MQKYFMEPGFSILIEYGWNTTESLKYLIPTTNERTIIQAAAEQNLNANVLNAKRINSYGNYDSFFAFIVGANVESENENFIINVNIIANGIIEAAKEVSLSVPLVVRLEGTNVDLGKEILAKSGLAIIAANDLGDAAQKIVKAVKEYTSQS